MLCAEGLCEVLHVMSCTAQSRPFCRRLLLCVTEGTEDAVGFVDSEPDVYTVQSRLELGSNV